MKDISDEFKQIKFFKDLIILSEKYDVIIVWIDNQFMYTMRSGNNY